MERQAGIPGTISEKVRGIRWYRIPMPPEQIERFVGKQAADPKGYMADVDDGALVALVSHDMVFQGRPLWHLSLSHRDKQGKPDRVPTWDELKHAMYRLIQADIPMVLIFPRRTGGAEYVDIHPTTLHLFESTEGRIDKP
jgi:hypothetical protein